MGERSGAPRPSALHQSSFRNLRLQFNYRSQMSQLTVTHPNALLSFHCESNLSADTLIVFPSDQRPYGPTGIEAKGRILIVPPNRAQA
jgi:hypothetical protein